nr:TonB-dependent receptor [Rhizobium skierniewicense]
MRIRPRTQWLRGFLVASTAIIPPTATSIAHAQEQHSTTSAQISFDIPAQGLARSLNAFARASNIKIAYSAALAKDKSAPALKGRFTKESALARLLAGSDLSYSFTSEGSVTISKPQVSAANVGSDGSTVLETITISGARGGTVPTDAELEAGTYQGAGTSGYLSQENIQRFRGSSPGDMLTGIPGVLNGENRNSGALDVNIRGMQGQGRSPVVIDGALQESTVYRGYAGMAGRTYVDPDFIGGVSIEKGPSAAADGTGAIGGIVRARTLNAGDIITPGGTWGVVVRGGLSGNSASPPEAATIGGSEPAVRNYNRPDPFDLRGKNGSVTAAYRSEMIDVIVGRAERDNGNYFAGESGINPSGWKGGAHPFTYGEQVTNTSMDNTSHMVKTVLRPNENHTLDLSYMRYESLFGEMKPSQLMWADTAYQTTSEVEVDTYTARYRYKPENPLIDLRADLWATNVDSFNVDPVRTVWAGQLYNDDMFAATLSERWGLTVFNTSRFSGDAGDLAVSYGFAHDQEDFGKSKSWDSLNAQYPGRAWDNTRAGWRRQDSYFGNVEYKPEQWVTLTAGLRHIDSTVQDENPGISWVQEGRLNRDEASGWAPSFSALVEPVKGIQFYGRYAEALRAASSFEGTQGFSSSVNPYTNLLPEHAHNTEVGVNLQKYGIFTPDDLFQAKAGWFRNDVTNYITLGSEKLTTSAGYSTDMLVMSNIPRVSTQGVEISASYDAGRFYGSLSGTEYTEIESCYARSPASAALCYDGMPKTSYAFFKEHIPPKRSFSATIGGRFFDEKLSLGARYTHIETEPGYELVDLFGSYRVSDTATLSFTVNNLFDKYYVDTLSLGKEVALLPSPGRTIRVNFVSRFGDGNREAVLSADARNLVASRSDDAAPAMGSFDGNWTGFYVGADWGGKHFSASGDTTAAGGASSAIAASEKTDRDANSILGGLHAGYNHQFGNGTVLGFEIDGGFTRARGEQAMPVSAFTQALQAEYHQSYGAETSGRVRLGQSFGRTLLYGTGGVGLVQEKQKRTQYRQIGSETRPYFSETEEKIRPGMVLGGGLEFAFSDRLSLRTEYLFGYYPDKKFDFERASQNIQGGANVPIGREASNTLKTHSLRVGLNYHF